MFNQENFNRQDEFTAEEIEKVSDISNNYDDLEGAETSEYAVFFRQPTIEETEQKEIYKTATVIGICFILLEATVYGISKLLKYLLVNLNWSAEQKLAFFGTPAFSQLYQIVVSITAFIIPFLLVYKIAGYNISELASFKKPRKKTALPLFFIGIGSCMVANLLSSAAGQFFENNGVDYEVNFGEDPQGVFGVALSILATVVTAALVEEFICRGLVLGALRKYGDGFSIFASALLFGLMHRNFVQIPFAFLIGLVLGYVTIKTGGLWVAIAIHAFNNGFSVLFDYLSLPINVMNFIYLGLMIVILFTGIFGIYLLKDKNDAFEISNVTTKNTFLQKNLAFFVSIPIVIFVIYCIYEACGYFVG